MAWDVEVTDQCEAWFDALEDDEWDAVVVAVGVLAAHGPSLGRPLVDSIHSSRHANMKELRVPGDHMRVLFAFDPRRTAILLLGGNKAGKWQSWYREMIPVADRLYDDHLEELKREGLLP
jgi:hypothetical protein